MKNLYTSLCCCLCVLTTYAQEITGTVTDRQTHEPLISATVVLKADAPDGNSAHVLSGLNGSFVFRNITSGSYKLNVNYVGYIDTTFLVSADGRPQTLALQLSRNGEGLQEVTVTTNRDRGTDLSALIADRRSAQIQNSLSAKAIDISPDISVANVTQRISGVSLERSTNGEGQYAIVRGMDKRYNYTLVNGIKIPSPDSRNRYIPLDIFPAELLDRLEVTKALTPNMEGDAIGGVINMIMKDAPAKFAIRANAALGMAQKFSSEDYTDFDKSASSDHSPRYTNGENYLATIKDFPNNPWTFSNKKNPVASWLGLSAGGRLFNNKLGVLVAGSYQNNYRNVNSVFFDTETDLANGTPKLTDIEARNYSIQQQRTGLHTRLDFKFNNANKINLYAGYFNLQRNEYRYISDTNLILGRTYDAIPTEGIGRVGNSIRTYHDVQQIFNTTLNGEHTLFPHLTMTWAAAYSKASDNRPDAATLALTTGVSVDPNTKTLVQAPLNLDQSSDREWLYSTDEDKSGYLNFTYQSVFNKVKADWSVGGMYRDKSRNSSYDDYTLRPNPGIQVFDGDITKNTFDVFNPQGSSTDALNYSSKENVGAAYAMVKLQFNKIEATGGARYENTDLSWNSNVPPTAVGKTGSVKYYDVLPSAHIKYAITDRQALRVSYFSAISRPNFYEVVPHFGGDLDADYQEIGNPYLKRTTAENFDIRYELFPKGLDQLLAGVFYKNIKNPIEYALEDIGTQTYYTPDNFGTAHNYGFEADVTKFFRQFGVKANYTYTDSKITTLKVRRYSNGTNLVTDSVNQSRPLQGQSKHIANFSFLYKDDNRLGLNTQLAFTYTSRRINTVSQFLNNDIWQKGFTQMDFSVEKRIARRLFVYAKVNNILNTPFQLEILQKNDGIGNLNVPYQKTGDNVFIRKDVYGTNYLLGVKFRM